MAAADKALEELKKKHAEVKAKAGELQSEVNRLNKKCLITENDLQDSSFLIGEARADAVTAREDKAKEAESLHLIEARFVRAELERKALSRSLSTVASQAVSRKETVDRLQIQIHALTRSNTAVASSRDTLQRRVEDLERDLMLEVSRRETLKSRNSLQSRFSSLKDHDGTKAQLRSSTSELNERLNSASGEHTREIAAIRAECAQELNSAKVGFERELEGVRVEYRSSTVAVVAEKLRLQSEVNAVNFDYENTISAINTQKANLQRSLEAAGLDYDNRTRVIEAEKLGLQESLDAAKRNLNNALTAAAIEKSQLQDEINTLKCTHEQQIEIISTQKLHLQERFDGVDNAKIKLESDLNAAKTENSNLRSQLKEVADDKIRLQADFRKFVDDREQAKEYLMSSLKKHVELDGFYDCSAKSMTAAVKLYDQSMSMAKDLLKELWEQSRTATTEYNRITRLHHAVLEDYDGLFQSLETKEVELNRLTNKLSTDQEQLADSKRMVSALKADIAGYQKQNERLKAATQLAFGQIANYGSSSGQSEAALKALQIELADVKGALSREREHSKDLGDQREKAFTDFSMLQEKMNDLLKTGESEHLIRGSITKELERVKIERNGLREQLQAADASIKGLERDKLVINTDLQISRHETKLARDTTAILIRDNPIRANELLGDTTTATSTTNSTSIPAETRSPKPESAATSTPTQGPLSYDEEATMPETIDLTSDHEEVENSASSKAAGGMEKANTRVKRKHPSEEGVESASRLLGDLIFQTNGIELKFNQFSDETRSNFANALAVVMEDHRTNVDAYKHKPHRKDCLACTSGHRSCDFKDGDDFACAWCESNSQLCVLRTEGSLYVLPRMQHETHDVYSERYWLAGQKVKKRRTGAQLLL